MVPGVDGSVVVEEEYFLFYFQDHFYLLFEFYEFGVVHDLLDFDVVFFADFVEF